jgi:hypothetical protein
MAFGTIIESVVVYPTAEREDYDLALFARLSAINGGVDLFPISRSVEEIVTEERLRRYDTRGNVVSGLSKPDGPDGTLARGGRIRAQISQPRPGRHFG